MSIMKAADLLLKRIGLTVSKLNETEPYGFVRQIFSGL